MSERKRKRQSDDPEPSGKSAKSRDNSSKIRIRRLSVEGEARPVLVDTPGLSLPPDLSFSTYSKTKQQGAPQELLLHSAGRSSVSYKAHELQDGGPTASLKHYIGIYNPEKNDIRLIEARKMLVRRGLPSEDPQARESPENQKALSTQRQDLGMTFGTKKAKKAIESVSQNAITPRVPRQNSPGGLRASIKINTAAAAVLESMEASAKNAPTMGDIQAEVDDAKQRPSHDVEATELHEAYPIDEIVGEDALHALKVKPWVDKCDAGEEIQTPSLFVSNRIEQLAEDHEIKSLKVLKYMLLLIQLYKTSTPGKRGRRLSRRNELSKPLGVDESLAKTVKERFSTGGEMNSAQVTKLIMHLCVFSLIVDNKETDVFDLRSDLTIDMLTLTKYYLEIGARLSPPSEKQRSKKKINKSEVSLHRIATLSLPLQFPKQHMGKRGR